MISGEEKAFPTSILRKASDGSVWGLITIPGLIVSWEIYLLKRKVVPYSETSEIERETEN